MIAERGRSMRIHIIKVLKYTNSILARLSSGPFLPPFLLSSSSAQNPSECARSSGTIESEEWIVAVVSAALSSPILPSCCPPTLPMPQKAKLFKLLLLLFLRLRMLALGRESGGIGRESAGRSRGDFVYRGKDEGGGRTLQRRRDQMFSHCMK